MSDQPSGKRPGKVRKPADQVRAEKLGKIAEEPDPLEVLLIDADDEDE